MAEDKHGKRSVERRVVPAWRIAKYVDLLKRHLAGTHKSRMSKTAIARELRRASGVLDEMREGGHNPGEP